MSDEDVPKIMNENDLLLLHNCIDHLEVKLLKNSHHADKKISFLTLTDSCLNEMLLCQGQDVIKADDFIKKLFNELSIQSSSALVNKIVM